VYTRTRANCKDSVTRKHGTGELLKHNEKFMISNFGIDSRETGICASHTGSDT
jgi:hypothetical protein